MELTKHFEIEDQVKNILFNANDERQEAEARDLMEKVKEEEKKLFIGG